MLWRPLRWLVLVLVGLAFLGGTTVQAMPPSDAAVIVGAGADAMSGCVDAGMVGHASAPASPHKGVTPDCMKVAQCLGTPDLPAQARWGALPVTYAAVAYWSPDRRLNGVSPSPTPFPPRLA